MAFAALAAAGCGGSPKPAPPASAAPAGFGPDALRYDLDLEHAGHELRGTERIGFRNHAGRPLRHVWVRAWDNAYGSCRDPNVDVTPTAGARTGRTRLDCTAYRLDLDAPVAPGERGEVILRIAIRPPARFDRFGRLGNIDVLGNALPVLAVSRGDAEPELPRYSFTGESFFTLVADWDVRLRVAPGEQVASTGTETGRDGRTVRLAARDERDFTLVIGPMERTERTVDGVTIRWFTREGASAKRAADGLRIAERGLRALQRDLGPYGAKELDVLDSPPHVANAGIAMEYPQLVLSPPHAPALVHELAHQWFYRLVGNDEWSDPWVDETLASFASTRTGRAVNGPDRLRGCDRRDRPAKLPAPVDSDMGTLERRNARGSGRVSTDTLYIEGPCALMNLQRRIGADRMTAFLRGLVRDHRRGVLTGAQLAAAIGKLPTGDRTLKELRINRGPSEAAATTP